MYHECASGAVVKGSQQLAFSFQVCGGHSGHIFGGVASFLEEVVGQLTEASSELPLKARALDFLCFLR